MNVQFQSLEGNKAKMIVEGVSPAFINTIRRVGMTEVPTMAIDEVQFTKNSSVLYDEILALRLGLIPLTTDLKTYTLPEECKCGGKGCSACQVKMTLNVKGPASVYSSDLKSKDPMVKPVYDNILLAKLREGQEIKLVAVAVLGRGKVHTKWSTGLIYYQNYPKITVAKGTIKGAKEIVSACPKNVLEVKEGGIKVKDLEKCNLCMACQEVGGKDKIEVNGDNDKFIVNVESWGQLNPKDILENAVDQFDEKLKEFVKLVK